MRPLKYTVKSGGKKRGKKRFIIYSLGNQLCWYKLIHTSANFLLDSLRDTLQQPTADKHLSITHLNWPWRSGVILYVG